MFNKNDPLISSVKMIMEKNDLERSVEKALNESIGIVSIGQLPHEKHSVYKSILSDMIAEATTETNLQELSRAKLNQYRWKAMDDIDANKRKTVVGGSKEDKEKFYKKLDKKIDNRYDGIDLAKKKIQLRANVPGTGKLSLDETKQIDEISQEKVSAYKKAATKELMKKNPNSFNKDDVKYMVKRRAGRKMADEKLYGGAKVAATEETINELSSEKLKKYVRKASVDAMKGLNSGTKEGMDKYMKRRSGVITATVKALNKDDEKKKDVSEENLNELSKKTLGSYIKKATNDVGFHSFEAGHSSESGNHEYSLKSDKKAFSRQKGVEKATDKLTKEENQLDEVSRRLAGRYIRKAAKSIENHAFRAGQLDDRYGSDEAFSRNYDKVNNRIKGIGVASKKLSGGANVPAKKQKKDVQEGMSKDELRALISKSTSGKEVTKVPAGANSGIKGSAWRNASMSGKKIVAKKSTINDPHDLAPSATFKGTATGKRKNLDEVSKEKAKAYLGSAVADLTRSAQEHGRDVNKKNQTDWMQKNKRNIMNRQVGIYHAIKKLDEAEKTVSTSNGYKIYKKKVHVVDPSKADGKQRKDETDREFSIRNKLRRPPNKADWWKEKKKLSDNISSVHHEINKSTMKKDNLQELTGKGALEKIRNHYLNKETEHKKQTDYTTSRLYTKAHDPEVVADRERVTKHVLAAHGNTVRAKRAGMLIRKKGEMERGQDTSGTNANLKMIKSVQKNTDKYITSEEHAPEKTLHKATLGATEVRQAVRNKNANQATKGGKRYNVTQESQGDKKKVTKIDFDPETQTIHGY